MEKNLHLLGPVQIFYDGKPVKGFKSQKAVALLCYLAYIGQPISRLRLANLFWGNKAEKRGLANLSRVLYTNNKLMPTCLQKTYRIIQFLYNDDCWIDTNYFDEMVSHDDLEPLIQAIELYRGSFMDEISLVDCPEFENWLASEQEHWRQKVSAVHFRLISLFHKKGDYLAGIKYASHLLALDPWREEAHQQMMLLMALSGQRMAALQQYKICCNILEQDLDVGPSEETRSLYEKILNGIKFNPENHAFSDIIPIIAASPINSPAQPPELVGAEMELGQILKRLENPVCRLLTIRGDANNSRKEILALHAAAQVSEKFEDGIFYFALQGDNIAEALNQAIVEYFHLPVQNHISNPEQVYQFD